MAWRSRRPRWRPIRRDGVAVAIGMLTSLVAAAIPARSAARVDPVQALKKGSHQILSADENRFRLGLAAVLAWCRSAV